MRTYKVNLRDIAIWLCPNEQMKGLHRLGATGPVIVYNKPMEDKPMMPLEFANVLQLTGSYREDSWNGERYERDWHDCASQALTELNQPIEFATPISVMLYPEYVDIWDWVEQTINRVHA